MNPTKAINALWYLVCLIVSIAGTVPGQAFGFLPPDWKPWILAAIAFAAAAKAHANLWRNPDGTPASLPYIAEGIESAAEAAYEAYRAQAGGRSLATGAPIPAWSGLMPSIQQAWKAAAGAAQGQEK